MNTSQNQCENDDQTIELDSFLNDVFRGRVIRKDLTKTLK
jgi:predicted ATP-dependent Lon-type protease